MKLPRACFVSWLLCHGRLKTKDRMSVYLPSLDLVCVLCGETFETCRHLFFECSFSRAVLRDIWRRQELPCEVFSFAFWNHCFCEARHTQNVLYGMRASAFSICVYGIWLARNKRLYAGEAITVEACSKWIVQMVYRRWKAKGVQHTRRTASIGRNFGIVL